MRSTKMGGGFHVEVQLIGSDDGNDGAIASTQNYTPLLTAAVKAAVVALLETHSSTDDTDTNMSTTNTNNTSAHYDADQTLLAHSLLPFAHIPLLHTHVRAVRVCEEAVSTAIHLYRLLDSDCHSLIDADDDFDNTASATTAMSLPSPTLEGLWESLVFEDNILMKLLNYVSTSVLFADKAINPHIISFNKVLRELGRQVSVRPWPKSYQSDLVNDMLLFNFIKDMCENPDTFVCVLIDEVESLTAASSAVISLLQNRKAACSGMEPSDAIRVVNALLTQIDALKNKKNVLILTTSNITEAIDLAFVDRADLKLYVGLPSQIVIYAILASTLMELMRCNLIHPHEQIIDWRMIKLMCTGDINLNQLASSRLYDIAQKCHGFSGRAIRKSNDFVSLDTFLDGLDLAVSEERSSRDAL
ncbi:Pachytene checkpoint protein 2 [Physocladia obscura]|uniref:Pachytene checkpoint protein 2 n=1 Tax=Physocladia obscura TaxID=109957 RepID=A0AAD5TA64_9FUNG|nr:Pachytene checkpoint protein 2 [Physocladia obscura]